MLTPGPTWNDNKLLHHLVLLESPAPLQLLPGILLPPQDAHGARHLLQEVLSQGATAVADEVQEDISCSGLQPVWTLR